MNKVILVLALMAVFLLSCSNKRQEAPPNYAIPKALEKDGSSYEFFSKRGKDDLLEDIYRELVSKDSNLRRLEGDLNELQDSKDDSLGLFERFNNKNKDYFNAADRHLSGFQDSLLRQRMRTLVASQMEKYQSRIAPHKELLELVSTNQVRISDLHEVLKIVHTLPVINNFQETNLPDSKSLEGYRKRQEAIIREMEEDVK
jgi:hypothetical protein